MQYVPMAIETVLVTEGGYSLRDIRGQTIERTEEKPREGLIATLRRRIPWVEDPGTVVITTTEEHPGMTSREVHQRLVQLGEHFEMKSEAAEDSKAVRSVGSNN